jgi:hypothetical protein
MQTRVPIPAGAERRIRREARSAARREIALKLRQGGKTLAAIGEALGVSLTRARQIIRKAEFAEGAPATERPSADSNQPAANGPKHSRAVPWVHPSTT